MQRGWTGSWKIHYDNDGTSTLLFRATPDWSKARDEGNRWVTDEGKLLAKNGLEAAMHGKEAGIPTLTLERGLERHVQDLLVACWIGKVWSEKVILQKREG